MAHRRSVLVGNEVALPALPLTHRLFRTTMFTWLWLIVRLYLAYVWIQAGWGKIGNPAWMETGVALKGFWQGAIQVPETGYPPIAYAWYRGFIRFLLANEYYTWFGTLVAVGELLVGIALLIGVAVGVAAFFGAFMNWNYIMAGSASSNGLLLVLAILLMLAWRVAGWYGVDRILLPMVWRRAGDVEDHGGQTQVPSPVS